MPYDMDAAERRMDSLTAELQKHGYLVGGNRYALMLTIYHGYRKARVCLTNRSKGCSWMDDGGLILGDDETVVEVISRKLANCPAITRIGVT